MTALNAVVSQKLVRIYSRVGFWHGTGRYMYRNGEVVDVLEGILRAGGLVPHLDRWDQKRGDSVSISVGRARVYARLYAELYRHIRERNMLRALRPRLIWSAYFFLGAKWVAWNEYTIFRPHILDVREKTIEWTIRLAREPRSFFGAFLFGASDIPGNYSILIGIRPDAVQRPTRGSRFVDLHEIRNADPIPVRDITHIEVPEKYLGETERFIASLGVSLPVLPIEQGDAYCWNFKFKHLAHGLPLSPVFARRASA